MDASPAERPGFFLAISAWKKIATLFPFQAVLTGAKKSAFHFASYGSFFAACDKGLKSKKLFFR
jgi:hypothetical protein